MAVRKEMVLYYTPEKSAEDQKLKGVLVRLGIRIRNITPEQAGQKVGYLAGLPGFEELPEQEEGYTGENREEEASVIPEKMLVLCGFGQRKLEEMLNQFRKAKIPPIPMKAVLTEHNSGWSLVELYQELRQEHEKMNAADGRGAAENTDGAADSRD